MAQEVIRAAVQVVSRRPGWRIRAGNRGISSDRAVGLGPNKVLSVPDAIGIALEEWWRDRVAGVQQELMPPGTLGGVPRVSQPVDQVTDEMTVVGSTPPGGIAGGFRFTPCDLSAMMPI